VSVISYLAVGKLCAGSYIAPRNCYMPTSCSKPSHPFRYSVFFVLVFSASFFVFWCFAAYRTLISIYLSIYLSVCLSVWSPLLGLGRFFSFLILYAVGRTPWAGDQAVARPLSLHRTTQTQNKSTQTFMPRVGLALTSPTSGGGSVDIVRLRTKASEIFFVVLETYIIII
jgi:hypothetical protein